MDMVYHNVIASAAKCASATLGNRLIPERLALSLSK